MSVYEKIADKYDERYSGDDFAHIKKFLKKFAHKKKVLEAGCGTFRWRRIFINDVCGVDLSVEMLKRGSGKRVAARAENLPFARETFDFVYIVNALHQFGDKEKAIREIFDVAAKNAELAIITPDFHNPQFEWYVYDYFPQTREKDEKRFASREEITTALSEAGFAKIKAEVFHVTERTFSGAEVFSDKFLAKHNTSQLAGLSENEYREGLRAIEKAIEKNPEILFRVSIPALAVTALKV